jgi:hypothetical protein
VVRVGQVQVAAVDVVDDAADGGDEHVDAAAQRVLLGAVGHAAVEAGRRQAVRLREEVQLRLDLLRELARRRKHEDGGPAGALLRVVVALAGALREALDEG